MKICLPLQSLIIQVYWRGLRLLSEKRRHTRHIYICNAVTWLDVTADFKLQSLHQNFSHIYRIKYLIVKLKILIRYRENNFFATMFMKNVSTTSTYHAWIKAHLSSFALSINSIRFPVSCNMDWKYHYYIISMYIRITRLVALK